MSWGNKVRHLASKLMHTIYFAQVKDKFIATYQIYIFDGLANVRKQKRFSILTDVKVDLCHSLQNLLSVKLWKHQLREKLLKMV